MSVQYKSADGWKNISSSSNNAVDTVENGNMNPVTSNAVYDKFASIAAVDAVTNNDLHPVTSNAVYDKLYGNAGAYYSVSVSRPAGGWTIDSSTGHMTVSSVDLTIANVPAGVYLAWIEASGDQNTTGGRHYCYNNSIARSSFGYQETGWGGTIWPSCIYKHAGGNVVPSLATDFEVFNPSSIRMVLQRLY